MDIFPTGFSGQGDSFSQDVDLGGGLSNRQKILIVVFAITLLVTGFVLYFGFFSTSPGTQPESMQSLNPGGVAISEGTGVVAATSESQAFNLEGVNLDFSVFNNEVFKGLEEFGSPLDLSGEKGRDNPFLPY